MICLDLPFPPSVNAMFFNRVRAGKKGRGLTDKYAAWRNEAGWLIQAARPGRIGGRVRIDIKLEDKGSGDVDNRVKGLIDLLVTHGVIDGDDRKHVRDVRVRWDSSITGARVEVFPLPA